MNKSQERIKVNIPIQELNGILDEHEEFWFNQGKSQARKEFIEREIRMECLGCGKSLHRDIMDNKIHIHLCRDCRIRQLKSQEKQ